MAFQECPRCGKKFNFWQRAIGEANEHLSCCAGPGKKRDLAYLAGICRGCPAGCLEKGEYADKK